MSATLNRIPAVFMAALVLAVAVFGVIGGVALADPPSEPPGRPRGGNILERLEALEAQVSRLEAETVAQAARITGLETAVVDLVTFPERVTGLETLLDHFSRDGDEIYITGGNLHVVNGTGTTAGEANKLGNIIIGYNELRGSGNDRGGSHMLVVGSYNNYCRHGGIVVGYRNTASGNYSSVSGGTYNTASGESSSVSGGTHNTASAGRSSVSGGAGNTGSGIGSSVSGGDNNTADGDRSSVSGGKDRLVQGIHDWRAGGLFQNW